MHNGLHPRSDVNRLYIPRKVGGRGLANTEDTVILAKISLEGRIKKRDEKLLCAARGDFENPVIATVKDMKKNIQDERIKKWNKKNVCSVLKGYIGKSRQRVKLEMAKKRRFENPN